LSDDSGVSRWLQMPWQVENLLTTEINSN